MVYRYLPFLLTLEAPVVITAFGGDPNSSRTLPYIPGSAIRGAAAKNLGDPDVKPEVRKDFEDLILGRKVRWLNAYPTYCDLRAVPTPESLRWIKGQEAKRDVRLIDLAYYCDGELPDEELERVPYPFITLDTAPFVVQPEIGARIHHQRDRSKGRAWKDEAGKTHGTVFVYEYLETDQQFEGVVQLRGKNDEECSSLAERVKKLLGERIFLGRSKRARYGGSARIQWKEIRFEEVGKGGPFILKRGITKGERFRLLLLSDAILRDPQTGQVDPFVFPFLVESIFSGRVEVLFKAIGTVVKSSFNRKWRMELPQALAVKAGSILVLEARENIPAEDIQRLVHEGVGERKEEGFGRFVLLGEPSEELLVRIPEDDEHPDEVKSEPPGLVRLMEERIVLKRVREEVVEFGLRVASEAQNIPSNNLLGNLRTILRKSAPEALKDLEEKILKEENLKKKDNIKQLENCRLSSLNKTLKKWLEEILKPEKNLMDVLNSMVNLKVLSQRHYLVSEESAYRKLVEKKELIALWLIEAVLSGLRLRNKVKEGGSE